MQIDESSRVAELAVERPDWIPILDDFGIDYCCRGKDTLAEACAMAGCEAHVLLAALKEHQVRPSDGEQASIPDTLRDLVEHIVTKHHRYLDRELPRLEALLDKVVVVHGARHPELRRLAPLFRALKLELENHMAKEEQILFPMIRNMEGSGERHTSHCGALNGPISVMEHEHDQAGEALRRMRELSDGYLPPDDACTSFRALYGGLAELEHDLHQHIHKENNILHPRAVALEASLQQAGPLGPNDIQRG